MKSQSKFRIGKAGCESRYYQIRGYRSTTPHTDDTGKRNPPDVLRIAANDLNDVIEYLSRFEAGFDVHSIKLIGMLVTISGTPYWG